MKRLFSAGLTVAVLSVITHSPVYGLTERFDESYRDNFNKGLSADIHLSDRHHQSFNEGLYKLSDRFDESYRDNLNKELSTETNLAERHQETFEAGLYRLNDRHQDSFIDGLNR
ncbi:hypothetical protein IQ268_15685 [Oculatella sp. LEGE 06141]|uniref:hypothetical protein n=1 Tax=Oculatella sp. LEGE 06141 TaxID=1828648 RepID=UPI00187ED153|nr:hypothetical protein [Oculatella sp. LEGE 06141]MBE9180011.1 hypothetical protein [Oculatella sp. LEGE 06141]